MRGFRTYRRPAVNGFVRSLAATLAAVVLLGACGTSPAGLPTAGGNGAGGGSTGGTVTGGSTDPSEAWPAWTACLRSHGLVVADPSINPHGQPEFPPGLDLEHLVTQPMHTACDSLIQNVTTNKGGGSTYSFDSLVLFAGCLRQHGLPSYPDPDPNEPQRLAPGYDKGDPAVSAAIDACHDLLVRTGGEPAVAP
jgi:hypothetical protein